MASEAKTSAFFPLKTVNDARKLFDFEIKSQGSIENSMTKVNEVNLTPPSFPKTSNKLNKSEHVSVSENPDVTSANFRIDPQIDWHVVEALYEKFETVFKSYCEVALLEKARQIDADNWDVRRLIKHVADIIWNTLSKAQYKDRPHLQSIYSYLMGKFSL